MPEINVNEMTFGVEIETVLPTGTIINGRTIAGLPNGWRVKYDCSIVAPTGYQPGEVVSPILKGAEGVQQVKQVCDLLNTLGAKVNRSTGLHVHIGWTGSDEDLNRLVHQVASFEKALFASTGTHSRETGRYCKTVRNCSVYQDRFRNKEGVAISDRYHVLNLTNLAPARIGTVEFRCFAGTLNASKMLGYIRLCLGLVEKSLKTKTVQGWTGRKAKAGDNAPVNHHGRKGEGASELARLFYALGWTKGRINYVLGDIQPEGVPTIEESKQELMRLAKKYDGGQEDPETATPASVNHWDNWDQATWQSWFRSLRGGRSGSRISVMNASGIWFNGIVYRRYTHHALVRVSYQSEPLRVTLGHMRPRPLNPVQVGH